MRPSAWRSRSTRSQAAAGLTRTLRRGDRPVLVRIPAGTRDGDCITAVGEPGTVVTIRVGAHTSGETDDADILDRPDLDAFIHEYSRPSALTRLTGWIRKAQSAA